MENMPIQNIDGVNYFVCPKYTPDMKKHLELIKNLELRDDDVISVGYPRSGNHWALEVISMVIRQEAKFTDVSLYDLLIEIKGDSLYEKYDKMPSPRCIATHLRAHTVPTQALEKNIPIIYLMRNPKDALVSLYVLACDIKDDESGFRALQMTWDEFFDHHMSEDCIGGTWFGHVLAMEEFLKAHPKQRVYIHSFEKMKKDPVGMIKELCKFLGKPDTLAQEIATATEFSNMKKVLKEGKLQKEEEIFYKGSDTLLRKGKSGGWKNRFTVAQSERFNKLFHEKLSGCKLADYVKDYL